MKLTHFALSVFLFNAVALGNGPTMVPFFQRSFVEEHGVLRTDQLLYAFAVSQVTPGPANLFVPSLGYTLFGITGVAIVILVMVLPAYIMLPLVHCYERLQKLPAIRQFVRGLVCASVGLLVAATVQIGSHALTQPIAWSCFLLTAVLTYYWKWHPLLSLSATSGLGAAWVLTAP